MGVSDPKGDQQGQERMSGPERASESHERTKNGYCTADVVSAFLRAATYPVIGATLQENLILAMSILTSSHNHSQNGHCAR